MDLQICVVNMSLYRSGVGSRGYRYTSVIPVFGRQRQEFEKDRGTKREREHAGI